MIYEEGYFVSTTTRTQSHSRTYTHALLISPPALKPALETLIVTYMEHMQTETC